MKKSILLGFCIFIGSLSHAQFKVNVIVPSGFSSKEAYFYMINGSKDVLISKEMRKGNSWSLNYPKNYIGMMKVYFPESNFSMNYISENKNVDIKLEILGNKVKEVVYLDESNKLMNSLQNMQKQREQILPVLYQIKEYYAPSDRFYGDVDAEILRLSKSEFSIDPIKHPFVDYYISNYNKFLVDTVSSNKIATEDYIKFIANTNSMLENSSLLRPILSSFLETSGKSDVAVDQLLNAVNLETPRGQTILSELIEIFDAYSMTSLKDKYLAKAKGLKCTINDRLASTLEINKNTEIGAKFLNYTFPTVTNTSAKSIYDVKADKKVIVFWSSTCSHCETELPQFIPVFQELKSKNIQIIGMSLDVDKHTYESKVKDLPWINTTELKGWYSSFNDTYNVHATPTYFILDANNKIIAKPDHINDVFNYLGIK